MFRRTLVLGLIVLTFPQSVFSQDKPVVKREFHQKPLLRVWFRLDERRVSDYVESIIVDYQVDSPISRAMKNAAKGATEPPELQGMLVLLTKGLVPMPVQLQFASIRNEKEFHRLVLRAKNQLGSTAKISGNGDHYTLDMDFSKGIPIFGSADGDDAQVFEIPGMDAMRNNPALMAQLQRTFHFRLAGNMMWQGEVPEIMEMNLPTFDELQPTDDPNSFDVLAEFNLKDIPIYVKSLLFNTLNMTAKTQLQQRDNEDQLFYDARRSNGDFWLELLRTAFYDIEKGKFSLRFAEGDRPVRVRLDLDARSNSNLEKVGKLVGGEKSRFASIRNRPAPMTMAGTIGLPGQAQQLLQSVIALAKRELSASNKHNEDTVAAIEQLHDLIHDTITSGKGDGMLQVTGDIGSGFALVGGIRIEKPDELRDGLDRLLSSLEATSRIERSVGEGGRRYVSLETGEVPVPGSEGETFVSAVHLTAFNSCLWFAYGGPSGQELLDESIQFVEQNRSGVQRSHEPFQFAFDLSQWLDGDGDSGGFSQLPRQSLLIAERKLDEGIASMFSGAARAMKRKSGSQKFDAGEEPLNATRGADDLLKPGISTPPARPSMLLKALEDDRDEVDVRVNVNGDGIDIDADIGLGIANMLMARGIDFQGRALELLMQVQSNKPKSRSGDEQ